MRSMSELIKYINDLPGYKISNTHFRLGSKIHIAHFYYAKRFFQNSFFASRLAFLIVKEILTDHEDKLKEFKEQGLTLVGYGLYSELLISLVEVFLKKKLSTIKINHDLVRDVDEPSFIKNYGKTYRYIIIIVPIGSTFSTAIKIKEFIADIPNKEILEPYINVLHVSHFPTDVNDTTDEKGLYNIEKNFGWTKKDGKTIWVRELSTSLKESLSTDEETKESAEQKLVSEKRQKYILSLKSEWNDIKNCRHCSLDENNSDERPLYFTDKSSVTPTLIFGKPKARDIKGGSKFILNPNTLKCSHLKRDDNHFRYYIEIEDFFQDNIEGIKKWIESLKKDANFKRSFNETSKVIIIAPCHYTNAGFVNLVNEELFSNAANIIYLETKNDHISNFSLLYKKELSENGTKVVFIDDTITTGGTFRKINFFIENTIDKNKPFNTCIVLLDRSNPNVHKQLEAKVEKYYSFANLYLPSLKDFDGECPLDIGFKRYNELAESSFLTRMKIHFFFQKNKLQERAIDYKKDTNEKTSQYDEKRYIRQVEAVHRIYEWCKYPNHHFDQTFDQWEKSFFDKTKSPFIEEVLNKGSGNKKDLSDETATLLKILTHSPFIHYKPIKDNLFNWVLMMLKDQIKKINTEIDDGGLQYNSFRDFKFLIRRAGLLNTNYLISKEIFIFLKELYGIKGLDIFKNDNNQIEEKSNSSKDKSRQQQPTLFDNPKEKENLKKETENMQDFHVFYTAQIKELLYLNEARSIHLEKIINGLKDDKDFQPLPNSYKQLLRFIQEENGILILNFWHFIKKKLEHISYEQLKSEDKIIEILDDATVKEHYRAKVLNEFLSLSNIGTENLHDNIPFIDFLKLMLFFEIEKDQDLKLDAKTNFILDQLKNIIGFKSYSKKNGAFFLVKYKKDKYPFVAYNKGDSESLDETILKKDPDLEDFLNQTGDNKLIKTIIEFHKKDDGKWYDLYTTKETTEESGKRFIFVPVNCNRILIVRFCKLIVKSDFKDTRDFWKRLSNEGQAIAGFYFYKQDEIITDIPLTRYLLLLSASISNFIERHHKNDEFRDWVESDTIRKLALLSGHSREMLMKIALKEEKKGISYYGIVRNLENLQMIVALENNICKITDSLKFNETFDRFYNVKGSPEINGNQFDRIGEMAKQIFEFEEIENPVPCIIKVFAEKNIYFPFHKSLLDIICFELLVNAKKNRWHFLEEEKISIDNFFKRQDGYKDFATVNTFTDAPNEIRQNLVEIDALLESNKLVLNISNTGPKVDDDTMILLNRGLNPKGEETIAGLRLIQELLKRDEFRNLGKIKFFNHPLNRDIGIYKFTVSLILNEMNNV